ncbi:CRISPR-associated helicase Cas3' [Desulfitobacterium sp.]|uniref:CRISPR-associated helicase Cas3' n=1 Tax=Desulfitobacterium sp. TaxID=49981 RepID=UPI002BA6D69F|nr:CRISPR-associated helicase Cas3' [Desulfitobacterium sp.]HVJ48743.1 CRISPR-associated helicase Cas3' [Desulfitobacterium sp.]
MSNDDNDAFSKIRGKFIAHRNEKEDRDQNLFDHLEETSILAAKYASKIGLEKHGELIGLLHDLGKASSEFDKYIKSATSLIDPDEDDYIDAKGRKGKIDHSSAGAQVIFNYFSNKVNESLFISQILALVIASHHSGLIDCLSPDGDDNFSRRLNKPDEKTRTKESISNLDNEVKEKIKRLLSDENLVGQFNQKIITLREDIDLREASVFKLGLLVRFLFSCLIDADRLNTADFEFPEKAKLRNQGEYLSWTSLIERLNKELAKFEKAKKNKVNILRQEISDYCLKFSSRPKGLYQLTVPTGGGKTLASLRFALTHADKYHMERIIYIIPYTSIIDQNAEKAREILEDRTEQGEYLNNIVLEHHSNLTPEEENTRQKVLSENWDAPIVFTTMVQFLEVLFGYGTRSARRMHQLANAVLIFDEIQTLPIRCVYIFNMAIRFLVRGCGSTVVLCTATQPLLDKVRSDVALQITPEQQMIPDVKQLFNELKRVDVFDQRKIGGWTVSEVVDLVEQELLETGSVLIIVNTKKAAINLFQQIKNHPDAKLFHLSTNMCPAHRMKILKEVKKCLEENEPVICVSTQLIEAGVDIDFGSVIRYLAGLDSIAQAAGRCNRNGSRPKQGRVLIVNPKDENLDKLKDIRIGRDIAERVLDEFKNEPTQFDGDIIGPKIMERYYYYYFYTRTNEMGHLINEKSGVGRTDNLFELLSTNSLSVQEYGRINNSSFPPIPIRQSFMTAAKAFHAIDSPTRGVIVPYKEEGRQIIDNLCGSNNLKEQYHLLKKAQRYSVNVFPYIFTKLLEEQSIHEVQKGIGVFYLDDNYYSDDYGLSTSPVKEMEFLYCGGD